MTSRNRFFVVVETGLSLLVVAVLAVRAQEKPPVPVAPATSGTLALPAPFKWADTPDTRPAGQIPQPEQEKIGLEFVRAYHPLRAFEIERNKSRNPAEFYQTLREGFEQRMDLERLRADNSEAFAHAEQMLRLDARCEQLALDYRRAELDKRPPLEAQLKELVNQIFEVRQGDMEERLKNLEQEYLNLKNTVEKRRKNKDRVVEIRALQLMGDEDIFQMW